jgi:hypothetical protein
MPPKKTKKNPETIAQPMGATNSKQILPFTGYLTSLQSATGGTTHSKASGISSVIFFKNLQRFKFICRLCYNSHPHSTEAIFQTIWDI